MLAFTRFLPLDFLPYDSFVPAFPSHLLGGRKGFRSENGHSLSSVSAGGNSLVRPSLGQKQNRLLQAPGAPGPSNFVYPP